VSLCPITGRSGEGIEGQLFYFKYAGISRLLALYRTLAVAAALYCILRSLVDPGICLILSNSAFVSPLQSLPRTKYTKISLRFCKDMFFTTLAVIGGANLAAAHPFVARDVASFPAGSSWDILLSKGDAIGNVKTQVVSQNFQVIDIDLFDTDKATIQDMKAAKQVICYFSAGSKEGWRPDVGDFKDGDTGKALDGWPDEVWVNVKSQNVRNIMSKRIKLAAQNGCSAIDPDNVDGFVSDHYC
jgi:hypothetical protein